MSWRLIIIPLKCLAVLIILYLLWCAVAYRDIPVERLEESYGGANLQQVNIDGVPLRYKVEGQGPAVVLIHSHYYDMGMWDSWVGVLKDKYTLIRFDMTSHGLTGPDPSNDYSMQRSLFLLQGLLTHLQIENVAIVGSSLGGNIAFHYAALNPDKVSALALINSGGLKRPNSRSNSGTIPAWIDYLAYLVPTAAFGAFVDWMITTEGVVNDDLVERFHAMFRREGNRVAEFERMRQYNVGEPNKIMPLITAPILIQWGEKNPQLPSELAAKMAAEMTGSSTVETIIYPGAGHVLPLEEPKGATDLAEFFAVSGVGQ